MLRNNAGYEEFNAFDLSVGSHLHLNGIGIGILWWLVGKLKMYFFCFLIFCNFAVEFTTIMFLTIPYTISFGLIADTECTIPLYTSTLMTSIFVYMEGSLYFFYGSVSIRVPDAFKVKRLTANKEFLEAGQMKLPKFKPAVSLSLEQKYKEYSLQPA